MSRGHRASGYNRRMSVLLMRHRFTIDDYHAMAAAGALLPDDRVELVEGEIVDMTPIGLRHAAAVNRLNQALVLGCGARAIVQIRGPFRIGVHSELQPDVLVLRPRNDFYGEAPAMPSDVLLLIEVADSSLAYDRTVKLPLYARAGVREAWLVDLVRNEVTILGEPGPDAFARAEICQRGDQLSPAAFPGLRCP
jgi:Uma2 family endonuclease